MCFPTLLATCYLLASTVLSYACLQEANYLSTRPPAIKGWEKIPPRTHERDDSPAGALESSRVG